MSAEVSFDISTLAISNAEPTRSYTSGCRHSKLVALESALDSIIGSAPGPFLTVALVLRSARRARALSLGLAWIGGLRCKLEHYPKNKSVHLMSPKKLPLLLTICIFVFLFIRVIS
jgi:hypothetical protein